MDKKKEGKNAPRVSDNPRTLCFRLLGVSCAVMLPKLTV
jgi:hypothetical protein